MDLMEISEDRIKEICAKICHEKMKLSYQQMKEEILSELRMQFFTSKLHAMDFISTPTKERIEKECLMYMSSIITKAYEKFMKSIYSAS